MIFHENFRQENSSSSVTIDFLNLGKWVIESMNLKQFSHENDASKNFLDTYFPAL